MFRAGDGGGQHDPQLSDLGILNVTGSAAQTGYLEERQLRMD